MKNKKLYDLILAELLNITHAIRSDLLQAQIVEYAKTTGQTYADVASQLKHDACLALAEKLSAI